jgi:PadR family transcriptional regulator PadR
LSRVPDGRHGRAGIRPLPGGRPELHPVPIETIPALPSSISLELLGRHGWPVPFAPLLIGAATHERMAAMPTEKADLLKGTLDLLILKALTFGPQHGYGVARWLEESSRDLLKIEEGSLYPALYRMEQRGWIGSEWGVSESNRKARYYRLTARGREQLQSQAVGWGRLVEAVTLVLGTEA